MKREIGEHYPSYEEREDMKREYYKKYQNSDDIRIKVRAMIKYLIKAHYWRAREAIEDCSKAKSILRKIKGNKYYPSYRLSFDDYASHWLYAQNYILEEGELEEFGKLGIKPVKSQFMGKGETYYYPSISSSKY